MDGAGSFFNGLLLDQVLLYLTIVILSLLGLVIFLSVLTVLLRLRNERVDRHWASLQERWEPLLLDALSQPENLEALWDQVGEADHLLFLEFVLQYAQRLGGTEWETLKLAAAPYLSGGPAPLGETAGRGSGPGRPDPGDPGSAGIPRGGAGSCRRSVSLRGRHGRSTVGSSGGPGGGPGVLPEA